MIMPNKRTKSTTYPAVSPVIPASAKRVFRGKIFQVYQWKQRLFDGSQAVFEMLARPDTTVVLPVTQAGRILVLRERQPGKDWFWALPGGRIEAQESPLAGAKRELAEETGYRSDDWQEWFTVKPISKIDWTIYLFLARNCTQAGETAPDGGEEIESHLLTWSEFLDLIYQPDWLELSVTLEISRLRHWGKLAEFKTRIGM